MKPDSSPDNLQRALRESEIRRQALLEYALDCIICADSNAVITDFNPAAERTFQVSRSEILGKQLTDVIFPHSLRKDLQEELFAPSLPGNIEVMANRIEATCVRFDGSEFPAEITVTRVLVDNQISYVVYVRDITARRLAEEELVRLAAIVESSRDAILGKDLNGRITSWNRGAELMYGYSAREVIGRRISMICPPDRFDEIRGILQDIKNGVPVESLETVRKTKSGKLIDVALTVSPVCDSDGSIVGASAIARDITAQKLAEEALRKANETSIYGSPLPIVAADAARCITMWNPAAEALLGWSEAEVIGKPNPSIPANRQAEVDSLHAKLLSGQIVTGVEVQRQKRDGSLVTISLSAAPIRDVNRKVKGILGFLTDVTQQKQSEEAIRKAEQKYRAIFENAVNGIYQTTSDGSYISANPALARMFGFESPEELIEARNSLPKQLYVNPKLREDFIHNLTQNGSVHNFEYQAYRKDGKTIWVSENAHVVRGPDGNVLYYEGSVEDTSQRHELEHQLQQMQKIEAVGRLAGGVAHDFNNILMAISSYAELLEKKLNDAAPRRYIGEIIKATDRGSSLTQGLLAFGRKQVVSPKVLDLNAVIAEQVKMLRRLIPENIDLQFVPGIGSLLIKADLTQIEQVVMNLVINARDAMPDGGRLVIETGNARLNGVDGLLASQRPLGDCVMLGVSDNGCGMSAETKSRIFEPFFTTKEQGKGTGLGLAIVFGIVKQNEGQIFLHTESGLGTTFKIYFPVAEAIPEARNEESHELPPGGTETILLVEDEQGVRESTAEYLEESGYTVLRANNGPSALQVSEDYQKSIHLLLTDLIMPEMSGRELSEKIAKARPGIRVLFMSGYSNNILSNQQVLDPRHQLLQKPFRHEVLGRRVREAFASSKSAAAGE